MTLTENATEWTAFDAEFRPVLVCPRCRALVEDDWAGCRACGLEIKHRAVSYLETVFYMRDPDAVTEADDE